MKRLPIYIIVLILAAGTSCKKYLDIVPDNVPTIDYAFRLRDEAEKYLYTCYSYLPDNGSYGSNPAFCGGDEFWMSEQFSNFDQTGMRILWGKQDAGDPILNYWNTFYAALRDCNIFLDNIDKVGDIKADEKQRWVGEVKFLKAYYHWLLLQRYGPIPVMDKNIVIGASGDEMKVVRQPVDSVVNLIARLYDEAAEGLPKTIIATKTELGRITQPIALSMKARLLVTAASPLFNGNTSYAALKNQDGTVLVNQVYSEEKWTRAALACKAAITSCQEVGLQLYTYTSTAKVLVEPFKTQMGIRNSVTEKWNPEIIWGLSNSLVTTGYQRLAIPRLDPAYLGNESTLGQMAPTLKMAELFYTENGVPITEDKEWDYGGRYNLRTADETDSGYLIEGYETVRLHFKREPRFYADLGFDGGIWFMRNGTWQVQAKYAQAQSQKNRDGYSLTGYFNKKIVNWEFVIKDDGGSDAKEYPWPEMRLADLYLLYAEASNEANGPSSEAYEYINKVRARAGIGSVQEAWAQYSSRPDKVNNKDGFREIVHQERLIEMAFEGSRFWDLRRWKTAQDEMTRPLMGWDIAQDKAQFYYQARTVFTPVFQLKDYLWPIKRDEIVINPKLVQNPGWK